MCGIFGFSVKKEYSSNQGEIKNNIAQLFKLSESRGKEASGLALSSGRNIKVYKASLTASLLLQQPKFNNLFENLDYPTTIIGHARLATNGASERNNNNQPVIKNGLVGIHNGIITNDEALSQKFRLKRENEVDTEVFLGLVKFYLNQKKTLTEAISQTFSQIEGAASVALLFDNYPHLLLATNTGSLYYGQTSKFFVFASERYILERFLKNDKNKISQLKPNNGLIFNLQNFTFEKFDFKNRHLTITTSPKTKYKIKDLSLYLPPQKIVSKPLIIPKDITNYVRQSLKKISSLRRCSRCLLPETMPFIEFDQKGVCNYCHNYKKMKVKGRKALEKTVVKYSLSNRQPDCIVAFSGGRDSSYALNYVKKVLKMNPITYSYDWGMLTDLGRRNQARMCGKLGIEHILISADIRKKRENIKKNVLAWLKKPDLGTIPLFMAGDKQYFYYANELKKKLKIELIIYAENLLEKTDFKYGFCGVKPKFMLEHAFNQGLLNKVKLGFYYLKEFLQNPAYLNTSLGDTFTAYLSSYFIPHNYLFLYQYIRWDAKEIIQILTSQYNWELAKDTKTTWRIGDGTAPFYNYIYLIMAGFTENDTFRSNQIREGDISRQDALELIKEDNKIRYESIKWYCDTIGIDFIKTLRVVNNAPKRYQ